MKFPFVSRKKYEALRREGVVNAFMVRAQEKHIAGLREALRLMSEDYEQLNLLEKRTRLRALRAEGACQFKDDRIRRVIGLIAPEDEAPTSRYAVIGPRKESA